ncbi:hypothetical protein AALO_G00271750 [Alosa alosa]|uniref:Ig-like domain-containing protein n=1 Tax=Alosa alosa TaxID=278164 RepID=A0AAV6FRC4_9TELE|nr:hypothetical protein AALO_G00271750 [Alosa alosa]
MELHLILTLTWISDLYCQTELYTFKPAQVFASTESPIEGGDVTLKCGVSGGNSPESLHMYLCKNGVGVQMERLSDGVDAIFTLTNVTSRDSGNYSCVYDYKKIPYSEVNSTGKDSISIQVQSEIKSLPAPDDWNTYKLSSIQSILLLIASLLALLGICYIAYRKIYKKFNTGSTAYTLDNNVIYYDHTGEPVQDIYDS